jgi:hypothetical protein
MGKSRSWWSTGFTVALLVGLLLACTGIRQDEFACEDAVAHLQQCCPDFTGSNIVCVYAAVAGGCDTSGYSENPDFDVEQSTCIRNEACAVLRSSGVCERVAAIPKNSGERGGYQDPASVPSLQVCP